MAKKDKKDSKDKTVSKDVKRDKTVSKDVKRDKAVSKGKAPAKQAASVVRGRGEEKKGPAPRGTVSTKPAGRMRNFFREVRIEMKKVTWPSRKEVLKSTGVVIVVVAIAAVFIGVFDLLWNYLVTVIHLAGS